MGIPPGARLILLDVADVLARVLLRIALVLPALRARLLVARLALGLLVARVLAARLSRVPSILPIVPAVLPPLGSLGLRIARRQCGERRHGERQCQRDRSTCNCLAHLHSPLIFRRSCHGCERPLPLTALVYAVLALSALGPRSHRCALVSIRPA